MNRAILIAIAASGVLCAQAARHVDIVDHVFDMKAAGYSVPSTWNFEGAVMPGTSCSNISTPYWRAVSPDGLSGVKLLPRTDWAWSSRPIQGAQPGSDCLPQKQVMKARDFLTYMLPILGVGFDREDNDPEAPGYQRQLQQLTAQQRPTVWSGDRTRFVVKYEIKGRVIEEYLVGMVMCSDSTVAYVQPPVHTYTCSGFVWRAWAPAGNLKMAETALNSITGSYSANQDWQQKWNRVMSKKISDQYAKETIGSLARGEQAHRILEQRQKAFDQAQAMRAQEHQDFMASMQRGQDLRNLRFQEGQYAKRQTAEDWCDYALDCSRSWDDRVRVGNCRSRETLPGGR